MDKSNSRGYSTGFYALGLIGLSSIISGLYYLFQGFNEEDFSEETSNIIEQTKQDVQMKGGELTPDIAIKIMALTNKQAEDIMRRTKPDIDERRRAALNDKTRYDQICQEYFEVKESAYMAASNTILKMFGNITMDDIQQVMSRVSPYELERKSFEYEKPRFDEPLPDKDKVKDIFRYYGNELSTQMRGFHQQMSRFQGDPNMQEYMIFSILILKLRIDDDLYLKYHLTETQIRYLLYFYNLMDDPEIKQINERISNMEGFMN